MAAKGARAGGVWAAEREEEEADESEEEEADESEDEEASSESELGNSIA